MPEKIGGGNAKTRLAPQSPRWDLVGLGLLALPHVHGNQVLGSQVPLEEGDAGFGDGDGGSDDGEEGEHIERTRGEVD